MKRSIACFALAIGATAVLAQEKEKTKMLDQQTLVSYHVNSDNKLNGIYTVRDMGKKNLWLRGTYSEGKRSGSWYTYDGAKLQMCYNYSQDKLLQVDSALLTRADVKILSSDQDAQKDARIPLLICPMDLYLTLVCRDINLPDGNFDKTGKMQVSIKAKVDKDGAATYSVIYQDNKDKSVSMPLRVNLPKEFSISWVPASYQGKALASEYTVQTILSNSSRPEEFRRFRWNY